MSGILQRCCLAAEESTSFLKKRSKKLLLIVPFQQMGGEWYCGRPLCTGCTDVGEKSSNSEIDVTILAPTYENRLASICNRFIAYRTAGAIVDLNIRALRNADDGKDLASGRQ